MGLRKDQKVRADHCRKAVRIGLLGLQMGKAFGDLSMFEGTSEKDGDTSMSRANYRRTRGNGLKRKESQFRLAQRKKLFTRRVLKHWHRLPRGLGCAPYLATLEDMLDVALRNLIYLKMSLTVAGVWTKCSSLLPSTLNQSWIVLGFHLNAPRADITMGSPSDGLEFGRGAKPDREQLFGLQLLCIVPAEVPGQRLACPHPSAGSSSEIHTSQRGA